MEYIEISETLQQYKKIITRIAILKADIEAIEITGISALSFDAREGIEIKWQRKTKKQREDIRLTIILLEQKLKIINMAILILPQLQREFITKKYLEEKEYNKVCYEMNISLRYSRKLKAKAIQKIVEILE
jgi:DNA-directed RNA polymerase specialized sigma24 family protein